MNFIKTFLAALLAFVLGSLAILLFGMFILFAIAGSMERTVTVKEGSILRIDFSEVINDAPSSDPLAGFVRCSPRASSRCSRCSARSRPRRSMTGSRASTCA